MPVTPSVAEFLHLYFILHTFTGNLSQKNTRNIFFLKKQGRKSSVKLIQHNTSGETSDVELVVRQFFLLYLFISQLWPLWFLRNFYTSGSKFVVCRMNCWRRVNEIQLKRVVLYKVNTLKKKMCTLFQKVHQNTIS